MYIIDRVEPYEDRGLIRTRIVWHNERTRGVADDRCNLTGQLLAADYITCIMHCQQYGHYTIEADVKFQELARNRASLDPALRDSCDEAFDKWVQANSLYPQSTPYS